MLALHSRMVAGGGAAEEEEEEEEDDSRACFCVAASCVSLLLFIVLAASVSVARACAATAAVTLLLGLVGWFAPRGTCTVPALTRRAPAAAPMPSRLLVHHRCACGLADAALPAFAYEAPAPPAKGDAAPCAVCLEDLRAGEMVRRLPACGHLFHVHCVDAWLRAHRTCPLCRRVLSTANVTAKAAAAVMSNATVESSADAAGALPPV